MVPEMLGTILYGVLILPSLYLMGSFTRPFVKFQDSKMEGIVYTALGLGIFSYYAVIMGHLKLLDRPVILGFLALVFALRWRFLDEFRRWLSTLWTFLSDGKSLTYRFCAIVFLLTSVMTFRLCFMPETANDSLCYQLNIPKIFAKYHSTQPLFYDLNSYMPMLMQHLYTMALVLGSPALAKLFHWGTGILLFFAVFLMVFQRTQRKVLALFCALALWLTPTCINEVTSTYVDVALALFLFLSLWIFEEARRQKRNAVFLFGGIFLGFAVSVKLIALLWAAAFAVLFFGAEILFSRRPGILQRFFFVLLGGMLGCGFWFVRNWIFEGNPVFPYMDSWFGGQSLGMVGSYARVGLPKTVVSFFMMPWNITFLPDVFDRGFWIGPFYLLSMPLALWGAFKNNEARFGVLFVLLFMTLWFFVVQNVRFLFPVLPVYILFVAIGYTNANLGSFWLRGVKVAAGGLVLSLFLLAVYHYRLPLKAMISRWSYDQYLENVERSYPVARWVNRNLPPDALIFNAEEIRQFYFERDMVREIWFRSRTHYDEQLNANTLLPFLKEKGFTHVLRAEPLGVGTRNDRFKALDKALGDANRSLFLTAIESKNIREDRYTYRIFEIRGDA